MQKKKQGGIAGTEQLNLMNDFWGFWNILFVAVAIWILIPIWLYMTVNLISVAWFKGKIKAQKENEKG